MKSSLQLQLLFLYLAAAFFFDARAARASGNTTIQSFSKAKKLLLHAVWGQNRVSFYCGCKFDENKQIDFSSCSYKPKLTTSRIKRIEWDHAVAAEAFGKSFAEWRQGHPDCIDSKGKRFKGRKCAGKVNIAFRYMHADMYNLFPAEGEINELRENFSFSKVPEDIWEFGGCKVKIRDRKIEPRPEIRGDIARTYFYMDKTYPGFAILSDKSRKLFEAWDKEDPVDAAECARAHIIEKLQGNGNDFLTNACMELHPADKKP